MTRLGEGAHVRLESISKSYGSVEVLHDVSFDVQPGEVHVLAGENGAGKSTLIKILGGVITDYSGTLFVGDQPVRFRSTHEAGERGIAVIHQELSLVPSMTVADNLYLGDFPCKGGFVQRARLRDDAHRALERVGLNIPLDTIVSDLPIAAQQLVEIAKGLRNEAKVVVMDEPTSALNVQEAERLFALISELKSRGVGIVYISHKMDEIERLADRITVLRDGRWIATKPAAEVPPEELVRLMVGEKGSAERAERHAETGELLLEAADITVNLNGRRIVDGVSVSVHAGEVVGLAGLEGSGNSALLTALFGGHRFSGEIKVAGQPVRITNPRAAIRNRIALLTSDRKATGLVLPMSVAANITLASLPRLSPGGWRSGTRERATAAQAQGELSIKAASLDMPVGQLSGGNQQKAALAKWIATRPQVLLLDEPTRGIDIGAKQDIYDLIQKWKAEGMAILIVTSELPELLELSDRICVMHRGRVVASMTREEATAESVIRHALNA